MNNLDLNYQNLLKDILENGRKKTDRTGTGTISVFGRQFRHDFRDGFPILTTKRMPFKTIVTELLWFLRGDTNIKYLVDNGCHIWDGDAYKAYLKKYEKDKLHGVTYENDETQNRPFSKEEFINWIKNNDKFSELYGELGPVYGKQWRDWIDFDLDNTTISYESASNDNRKCIITKKESRQLKHIDQITNLIRDLKNNPDSRRLMVNAWNVAAIDSMTLPPCHYGFQVYTRELSFEERALLADRPEMIKDKHYTDNAVSELMELLDETNIPKRAISLMWNQRSVDTFLGLPFNIASYGLLLELIAKSVNMVPDELIGNLGDVHLYSNHIEQAKEQIGRELSLEERKQIFEDRGYVCDVYPFNGDWSGEYDGFGIPKRTREPFPLPSLTINTEFWPTENGSCGEGPLDAKAIFNGFFDINFCKCLLEEDIQLDNYKSHPSIKAPLSN